MTEFHTHTYFKNRSRIEKIPKIVEKLATVILKGSMNKNLLKSLSLVHWKHQWQILTTRKSPLAISSCSTIVTRPLELLTWWNKKYDVQTHRGAVSNSHISTDLTIQNAIFYQGSAKSTWLFPKCAAAKSVWEMVTHSFLGNFSQPIFIMDRDRFTGSQWLALKSKLLGWWNLRMA